MSTLSQPCLSSLFCKTRITIWASEACWRQSEGTQRLLGCWCPGNGSARPLGEGPIPREQIRGAPTTHVKVPPHQQIKAMQTKQPGDRRSVCVCVCGDIAHAPHLAPSSGIELCHLWAIRGAHMRAAAGSPLNWQGICKGTSGLGVGPRGEHPESRAWRGGACSLTRDASSDSILRDVSRDGYN